MAKTDRSATSEAEKDAITTAFLDERDVLYEIADDALNLMAFTDAYWKAHKEQGARAPATIVAQGKMFAALKIIREKELRERVLAVQRRLCEREAVLTRQFAGGE